MKTMYPYLLKTMTIVGIMALSPSSWAMNQKTYQCDDHQLQLTFQGSAHYVIQSCSPEWPGSCSDSLELDGFAEVKFAGQSFTLDPLSWKGLTPTRRRPLYAHTYVYGSGRARNGVRLEVGDSDQSRENEFEYRLYFGRGLAASGKIQCQ